MEPCKFHEKIQSEVEDLKTDKEKQWTEIGKRPISSVIYWILGILIVIVMAMMGGLWKGQASSTDKIMTRIEVMDNQGAVKRDEMNTKLDGLKENVNKLTWSMDEHLKTNNKAKVPTK
jgi:ABC-type lipoprotein release transport system permease subunit